MGLLTVNQRAVTTMRGEKSTGIEISKPGRSDVYISRNPEYESGGKFFKEPQVLNIIGITSIHEIGGHAYYSYKGYQGHENNKMTTDFDNRIRQVYIAKHFPNYFKSRPSIPHAN